MKRTLLLIAATALPAAAQDQPKIEKPVAQQPKIVKPVPDKVKTVAPTAGSTAGGSAAASTAAGNAVGSSAATTPSATAPGATTPSVTQSTGQPGGPQTSAGQAAESTAVEQDAATKANAAKRDVTPPPVSAQASHILTGQETAPVTPPSSDALTLEESIALGLSNHGDVSVAREQLQSAIEKITTARAGGSPQLNLEAGYNNRSVRGSGGVGSSSGSSSTTELVLRQNLFDSGLRNAQTRGARAQARGALAGVGQARSVVAFDVAQTYFTQLRQERLLTLAHQQVELAKKNLELVQAQAQAGVAAVVDQTPVEVELRQREFNVTQAENDVRTARVNFRNALGLGRGSALKIQDVTGEATPLAGIEAYFTEAQRLNPDLKISQANLESAAASLQAAKIQEKPQFSVDAALGVGIFDSPRRDSGFTASVTLPLLDGGARRANRRAAQDGLEAATLRDEQQAKDIAASIESAYASAQSAGERIAAARALETSARSNLDVATEKYRQGLGIALEITTAQVQLFNAQVSTIGAIYDYYVAQSQLERATGRRSGLATPPATVVPTATTPAAPATPGAANTP